MKSDEEEEDGDKGEDMDSEAEKSDDSGFGIAQKKGGNKKKPPLKRMRMKGPDNKATAPEVQNVTVAQTETGTAQPNSNKGPEDPVEAGSSANKSKTSAKSADKVMSMATSILNGLRSVSLLSIWQQNQRMKDMDGKVAKALDCISRLEGFDSNKSCEDLAKELSPIAQRLSAWLEIVNNFKPKDSQMSMVTLVSNFTVLRNQLITACDFLTVDCLKTFVMDLGKSLAEACSDISKLSDVQVLVDMQSDMTHFS